MSPSVITFLSDYGLSDDFVGVCHGVIAGICPEARVIDLTHGVPRGDIRAGALVLRGALPYVPVGVHLAVVDPGVGGDRRAVALRLADGRVLVGPDNGLLSLVGPVVEAVDIGASPFSLQPVSATFHGRDVFAPVAAWLAGGAGLAEAGAPVDPAGLVAMSLPRPRLLNGALNAHALYLAQLIVAVSDEDQGRPARQPPADEAEQVDRRLVRPVHVLDHDNGERRMSVQLR